MTLYTQNSKANGAGQQEATKEPSIEDRTKTVLDQSRNISLSPEEKSAINQFLKGTIDKENLEKLAKAAPSLNITKEHEIAYHDQFKINDPSRGLIVHDRAVIIDGKTGQSYALTFFDLDKPGTKEDFKMTNATRNISPVALLGEETKTPPREVAGIISEVIKKHWTGETKLELSQESSRNLTLEIKTEKVNGQEIDVVKVSFVKNEQNLELGTIRFKTHSSLLIDEKAVTLNEDNLKLITK